MKLNEVIGNILLVGPNSVNYSKKLSGLIKTTVLPDALKSISVVTSLASINSLWLLVCVLSAVIDQGQSGGTCSWTNSS